ncbi:MAG: hypothetical protein LC635_06195, partial [Pseudonocardiaceae bacterium]|nr:hypothetical protein [Pseudonocardiaceae bacterium]
MSTQPRRCPCGTPLPYDDCCGRIHRGAASAPTAEALMRSRYSAFATNDADYLLRSWHPDTRPATLTLDPGQRWVRLEILGTTGGGLLHNEGTVEFRAFAGGGTSPVVAWLRGLARKALAECGGSGVGAIGLCFT